MISQCWVVLNLYAVSWLVAVIDASPGDVHPHYRNCIKLCEETGCVGERCFPQCKFLVEGSSTKLPWYMEEGLYLQWKVWDCKTDCRYYCMVDREKEREASNSDPVKYHGKWPLKRVLGIQEPASVALSALNLAMHFHGWKSFLVLLYREMPLRKGKTVYYEYATLWHIFAFISMISWFWSAVFHCRDVEFTEKLDYSSAVASLGFSLIMSILRSFSIRHEAARIMVTAPLLAFVTTHIFYINFYKLDYVWNLKVCLVMDVVQLSIWAVWAGVTWHPSRCKLWFVVIGGALAMLLELYDFPPYQGFVDAHVLWHASTIPLTYIWWSFIIDDAQLHTFRLLQRSK